MFNRVVPNPADVLNLLILVTKQLIYASRCMGRSLDFIQIRRTFLNIERIERNIAYKSDKIAKHKTKWSSALINLDLDTNNMVTQPTSGVETFIEKYC